jgi:O-antigen/teichoic acid export membrane protein
MSIAFVPVYVRYLGIEAYGLMGIFTMLQTCIVLLDAGITPTLSRELALSEAGIRSAQATRDLVFTVEVIYLIIVGVVVVGLYVAAPSLVTHWIQANNLPPSTVTRSLQIMAVVLGLRWLTSLYRGAYIGLQRQIWLNLCASSFSTLRGLGAVGLLMWISPTISAFFIYQGILAALEAAVMGGHLRSILPKPPRPARFSTERLFDVWRFAAGMTTVALLATMLTQFDKFLLSKLLPLSAFGYYVIASSVSGALYLLVAPIANASYPQFTAFVARGDQPGLALAYHKFAQITAIVVVPATLVLVLFSRRILLVWTRDPLIADAASPLVSMLAFGNMLHGLMHTSYTLQLAYGRTRFNILVNAVAVVVLLPAIYVGVTKYGAIGAAAVWVILNLGYVLIATPIMHRALLTGEMWRWYRQDVLTPFAFASASVGVLALLVPPTSNESSIQAILLLAFAIIVAVASAAVGTPLGRHEICAAFRRVRRLS